MSSLTGWHPGERIARKKTGFDAVPATRMLWSSISGEMPEQHSTFYTTRLPFIPVCILVKDGEDGVRRPWGSFLVGKDGRPGFASHPRYNTLRVQAALWDGDPFLRMAGVGAGGRKDGGGGGGGGGRNLEMSMIAGIGIEVSTRRRNKFAGHITKMDLKEGLLDMELVVNEAIGNCPKYITLRELAPITDAPFSDVQPSAYATQPQIVEDRLHLSPEDRLSDEAISFILAADTVFLGTAYIAPADEAKAHPSHLGMNHRGGRPGFVRVKGDGRTVVIPDFSGNRFMTSLGNIEATPLACLSIPSFTSGDVLYLTGTARNVYGAQAQAVMPFQDRLTEIHVTGYTFVRAALPLRAVPEYKVEGSPYSPPVKLLAEELPKGAQLFDGAAGRGLPQALLRRVEVHGPDLATFTWEMQAEAAPGDDGGDDDGGGSGDGDGAARARELAVQPGQAVIMDFKSLLGERRYAHMMPGKPTLVNDDYVRTWTVSRFSPRLSASDENGDGEDERSSDRTKKTTFALTMREQPGGTVTGALFGIVRKLQQVKPHVLADARDLHLAVGVVGVNGDFVLPPVPAPAHRDFASESALSAAAGPQIQRLVWIAGGIGITPFLAMLRAVVSRPELGLGSDQSTRREITLVVSTREADVMASLVSQALNGKPLPPGVSVHIFSTVPALPGVSSSAEPSSSTSLSLKTEEDGSHRDASSLQPSSSPSVQVTHASGLRFTQHAGRVRLDAVLNLSTLSSRSGGSVAGGGEIQFYVCGPLAFETAISESLAGLGVSPKSIHRETFAY